MKKIIAGLFISMLCVTAASAFNEIALGRGVIMQNDNPPVATVSLESLNPDYVYNLNCKVKAAEDTPIIFRVDIAGITLGLNTYVFFDGNALGTNQAQINDNNDHHVTMNGIYFNRSSGVKPTIILTRLANGGKAGTLEYDCSASYTVGKK